MRVRPLGNYHLLGTDWHLEAGRPYDAEWATNQPEWEEKGKIFILEDSRPGDGFLLEAGEYEVVDTSFSDEVISRLDVWGLVFHHLDREADLSSVAAGKVASAAEKALRYELERGIS